MHCWQEEQCEQRQEVRGSTQRAVAVGWGGQFAIQAECQWEF